MKHFDGEFKRDTLVVEIELRSGSDDLSSRRRGAAGSFSFYDLSC